MTRQIRNIAIIAHVDHGKTTLVDQLLRQSGTFRENEKVAERVMDSNDLERERGITILAKNCAVEWKGTHINIVDTPGHADFGGEVERVLSMVDGVLLLVDAVEGPMPQTRFVTEKALALGLKPIVVVNKIDRPGARRDDVINEIFDLFVELDATEEQLDFPVIFALGPQRLGDAASRARSAPTWRRCSTRSCEHVPAHEGDADDPLQLQICSLDYSTYVGRIGIGRVNQGTLQADAGRRGLQRPRQHADQGARQPGAQVRGPGAQAGRRAPARATSCSINGIEGIGIGVTLTDLENPVPLPMLHRRADADDELLRQHLAAGRARGQVRHQPPDLRDRLERELQSNVALKVKETDEDGIFEVSGRGELHLTILLENMRREGYELAVGKPRVVFHEVDGERHEPIELVTAAVTISIGSCSLSLRAIDLVNTTRAFETAAEALAAHVLERIVGCRLATARDLEDRPRRSP